MIYAKLSLTFDMITKNKIIKTDVSCLKLEC